MYVHRIGFDPPPIKEENRLKGDLDEVENIYRRADHIKATDDQILQDAIMLLSQISKEPAQLNPQQNFRLNGAGNVLSKLAINEPGKYLKTLDVLNQLLNIKGIPDTELIQIIINGLDQAVNKQSKKVEEVRLIDTELSQLFRENLEEINN